MACQRSLPRASGQCPVTKERGTRPAGGSGPWGPGACPRGGGVLPRASTARRCLRLVAAAVAAAVGVGWLATVPAAAAPGAGAGAVLTAAASQPGPAHPWIAITSLSPTIATPKGKVIVSGIVANPTPDTLQGLSVQLWSSDLALSSRSAMHGYLTAQSSSGLDAQVLGAQLPLPGRVPPHGTEQWTLTLNVSQGGMHKFGAS